MGGYDEEYQVVGVELKLGKSQKAKIDVFILREVSFGCTVQHVIPKNIICQLRHTHINECCCRDSESRCR